MRLLSLALHGHRSVEDLEFDAGQFTVLFGRNNAGKTNILEAIAGIFAPKESSAIRGTPGDSLWRWYGEPLLGPRGAAVVQLEPGVPFDDAVVAAVSEGAAKPWDGPVSFTRNGAVRGYAKGFGVSETAADAPDIGSGDIVAAPELHVLFLDWRFDDLHGRVEASIAALTSDTAGPLLPWLETVQASDGADYRVPAEVRTRVDQLSSLASDLLPDFVDGSIDASVTSPSVWGDTPKLVV